MSADFSLRSVPEEFCDPFDHYPMMSPIGHGQHRFDRHSEAIKQLVAAAKPGNKTYKCLIQGCKQRFSLNPNSAHEKLAYQITTFIIGRFGIGFYNALSKIKENREQVKQFWNLHPQPMLAPAAAAAEEEDGSGEEDLSEATSATQDYYWRAPVGLDPDAYDDHGMKTGEPNVIAGYYQDEEEVEEGSSVGSQESPFAEPYVDD